MERAGGDPPHGMAVASGASRSLLVAGLAPTTIGQNAVNACFQPERSQAQSKAVINRHALQIVEPRTATCSAVSATTAIPARLAWVAPRSPGRMAGPQGTSNTAIRNAIVLALAAICAAPDPPAQEGIGRPPSRPARRSPRAITSTAGRTASAWKGPEEARTAGVIAAPIATVRSLARPHPQWPAGGESSG